MNHIYILAPSFLSWKGEDFIRVRAAPPRLIVVRAGGPVRLSCSVLASPAPRVTWAGAGVREPEPRDQGDSPGLAETVAVLSVPCADRSHSGVFRCLGESGLRRVEVVTRVVVTSAPGETIGCGEEGEPPVITNWFKTLMVPIGQPAGLDCRLKVHSAQHILQQTTYTYKYSNSSNIVWFRYLLRSLTLNGGGVVAGSCSRAPGTGTGYITGAW